MIKELIQMIKREDLVEILILVQYFRCFLAAEWGEWEEWEVGLKGLVALEVEVVALNLHLSLVERKKKIKIYKKFIIRFKKLINFKYLKNIVFEYFT